ncbi:helix-turn-helix domain-containing protein [Rhodococcus rhodochrous]|uniref:helix-turn-helix domain-containing protein n=1 Tax=Rhodococcus rhodochrous TaxID=1829 RepID=UPI00037B9B3B|nr:helix-turn-helix domain-containing protein [Rhodococcus rhodochrous]
MTKALKPMTLADVRRSPAAALTLTEVAQVLGIDRRTVARAIQDGTMPAVKFGRRVLIPREPFLAMFAVHKNEVA